MKRKIKSVFISILFVFFLLSLTGCYNSKESQNNLDQKVNAEISFIDYEIISIVNDLNNIDLAKYKVEIKAVTEKSSDSNEKEQKSQEGKQESSGGSEKEKEGASSEGSTQKAYSMKSNSLLSNNKEIEWSNLKSRVENLYSVWTTISSDLKEIGVNEENLKKFEQNMDNLAIAVKQEEKRATMDSAIQIYKLFIEFAKDYGSDKDKNVLQTKYNLLICYNCADQEQWEQFQEAYTNLKMSYSNLMNKISEYKGKEVNIKNAGIIISEINNSISIRDKDVFFIKYKNLMQELNIISSI